MVESVDKNPTPTYGSTMPVVFLNGFQDVLKDFQDVFAVPTGLPPARSQDHHIPLLLGTAPVNVKPYRYPHFQKS